MGAALNIPKEADASDGANPKEGLPSHGIGVLPQTPPASRICIPGCFPSERAVVTAKLLGQPDALAKEVQRVCELHETMRRVKAGCRLVQRVDDDHRRADGAGAIERTQQRVGKQNRTQAPTLLVLRDGQTSNQGAPDELVTREVLPGSLGNLALGDRHGAERTIAERAIRLAVPGEHEDGVPNLRL